MLKKIPGFVYRKLLFVFLIFAILLYPRYIKTYAEEIKYERIELKIKDAKVTAEVADTDEKRAVGLMHREKLGENEGMLFVFKEAKRVGFWMKDTKIPLSIAYIDESGIILEIYDLKPGDTNPVFSKNKIKYALEVNRGWFKKKKITEGDAIKGLKK